MTKLDIMQQGDILSGFLPSLCSDGSSRHVYCVQSITHLRLQNDCNIVQKVGLDGAKEEYASIIWDSKSEKTEILIVTFSTMGTLLEFLKENGMIMIATFDPARQGLIWRTPRKNEQGDVQDNWEETELGDRGFYPD